MPYFGIITFDENRENYAAKYLLIAAGRCESSLGNQAAHPDIPEIFARAEDQ